jgi:hypothetical protein
LNFVSYTTEGFSDDASRFAEEVGCCQLGGTELDELIAMSVGSPRCESSGTMPPAGLLSKLPADMQLLHRNDCMECWTRLSAMSAFSL